MAENISPEYRECLEKGRLKKFPQAAGLAPAELEQAAADLMAARQSLAQGSHKWASIQAYYAMFHAARAFGVQGRIARKKPPLPAICPEGIVR
ncbi:MAG: HEPN domain-containing protein [bacterium]|nr:HEPN domain-containing protein [bacterium]